MLTVVSGFGGALPTLCKLAAGLVAQPDQPGLTVGVLLGVLLYGMIGAGVSLALTPIDRKQALAIGIAAPAIISSLADGVNTRLHITELVASSAYAQETPNKPMDVFNDTKLPEPTSTDKIIKFQYSPPSKDFSSTQDALKLLGYTDKNEQVKLGTFSASDPKNQIITIPGNIKSVEVAGDKATSKKIDLESMPKSQLNVSVNVAPTAYGDFLWVLGARRTLAITGVDVKAQPTQ